MLRLHGQRVSVVKHAHHKFDIDHPGKDTYRHREAGAFEVVVASDKRLALMREFERPTQLGVHELIAELDASVDWVLVEGFKHSDLQKMEVWRHAGDGQATRQALYAEDEFIVAVATDAPPRLPVATTLPVFDLNDVDGIGAWLMQNAARFEYKVDRHG